MLFTTTRFHAVGLVLQYNFATVSVVSKCTPLCKAKEEGGKLQVDNLIDYVHLTLKLTSQNQTQNSIETFQLDYFVSYIPVVLNT